MSKSFTAADTEDAELQRVLQRRMTLHNDLCQLCVLCVMVSAFVSFVALVAS